MKQPHIPESALKKHIAILGMNGSGKTSVAKAEVIEPAIAAGARVCNIDPTGVGWGLRLKADGKTKGLSIYIVGGEHADFPLVRRDGNAWADIVGTSADSFVFDTSQMTVGDRGQWFTDFAETLLRKNKGPLNLVLDEAHLFAPQGGAKSGGIAPRMLHATNNLLALGRSRGLRITMISQRAAKLHKDALTQAHTLVAMMMTSPQDRGAVEDWIKDQADPGTGRDIIASLPTLKPGEGWIWAPAENVLERVRFARPKTFDSSSAPEEQDECVTSLPALNPDAVKAKLAAVARETMSNDVPALKAEIARLQREAAKPNGADPEAIRVAESTAYERGRVVGYQEAAQQIASQSEIIIAAMHAAANAAGSLSVWSHPSKKPILVPKVGIPKPQPAPVARPPVARPAPARKDPPAGDGALPKAQRLVLTALAQYPDGRTTNQVAILAGYAVNGGGFRNALSSLRSAGRITGSGERLMITPEGIEDLGPYEPLPHGFALLDHWMGQLSKAEKAALQAIVGAYPEGVPTETVASMAGYEANGGGFRNALSRLRTLELIEGRDELKASDALFG